MRREDSACQPVLRTRDALKEPELLGEAQSALWVGQAGGSSSHLGVERWGLRGKRADWEEPSAWEGMDCCCFHCGESLGES